MCYLSLLATFLLAASVAARPGFGTLGGGLGSFGGGGVVSHGGSGGGSGGDDSGDLIPSFPALPYPRDYNPDTCPGVPGVESTGVAPIYSPITDYPDSLLGPDASSSWAGKLAWPKYDDNNMELLVDHVAASNNNGTGTPRPDELKCTPLDLWSFVKYPQNDYITSPIPFWGRTRYAFDFTSTGDVDRVGMYLNSTGERIWAFHYLQDQQSGILQFALLEPQTVVFYVHLKKNNQWGQLGTFRLDPST